MAIECDDGVVIFDVPYDWKYKNIEGALQSIQDKICKEHRGLRCLMETTDIEIGQAILVKQIENIPTPEINKRSDDLEKN